MEADSSQMITNDHQQSFFIPRQQNIDISPLHLSGDQNAQQTVYSTIADKNQSNFFLTTVTLIKTVIGAGILSLPFTVSQLGYVLTIIMFIVFGSITHLTAILLINAKNLSGHSNYASILYHLFRNKFAKGVGSIFILLNNMGVCIAEMILIKSTIRKILQDILPTDSEALTSFYTQTYFFALIMVFCQIPFIMFKKIQKLKFLAFLGVSGIFIFIISFVIHYTIVSLDTDPRNNPVGNMNAFPTDWFKAAAVIPNLILAISYQMNFFPIYKGMKNANDKKFTLSTLSAVLSVTTAYILVGILGYNLVGGNLSANFLQSLPYSKTNVVLFYIINGGILISVFCSFPLMFFGCRNNFIAIIQLILMRQGKDKSQQWRSGGDNIQIISSYVQSQDRAQKKKKARLLFIIYTAIIFVVIGSIGTTVNDIQSVFNIIGAVCSNSIGVLLPCLFYFTLTHKKNKKKGLKYYTSIVIFVIMLPYALFSIVAQKIS